MFIFFSEIFSPPRHTLLLVIAMWIGLLFAEKRSERYKVSKEDLNNLIFYSLIAFIIGGRIFFILQNISAFIQSPAGIFSINTDLFDLSGGLATAAIAGLIYSQRKRLNLWSTLDALTPLFSMLAIGLGLSHLASGAAFGKETKLAFGIDLWNATRYPTQIYETLAALLTFGLIWLRKENQPAGLHFLAFTALTAFFQIIIQSFRADTILIFNGIGQGQVIAWLILLICFLLFEIKLKARHE